MAGRWVMASIQMSFSIMPALVYWYAGFGDINYATVIAFTTLQTRLFFPLGSLLSVGVDVQTSLALFDRIFEYLDLPVEIDERPDAVPLPPCKGDVAFDEVWFRYDPDAPWTLQNVSFEVPAGTRTAIVGETGSGKTTIGYLAARLYEPDRGRVLLDGIDIRDVTFKSLAATIGVVSQETYLFHATIRENLRFAKPEATDEEVEEAARAAHIHDLIESLEDGYDTMVGERGYRFSGGEKQRMAIARTVLRNPRVLILDEATSALDTRTERAVQAELDRLVGGQDDDHDRAPPVDRPRRGPDPRARPRRHRRARHSRGAARARRRVRAARRAGRVSRRGSPGLDRIRVDARRGLG